MIRYFLLKIQYLRMRKQISRFQPYLNYIGFRMPGASRVSYLDLLAFNDFKGPFASNYEGVYCRPEKVDSAVVEVLSKVPRCSIIVADNQRSKNKK